MLQKIKRILSVKVVKEKIIFSLLVLLFFRFLSAFPIPGVQADLFRQILSDSEILQVINLLTGGFLYSISILTVGLGPYITASYILQILSLGFESIKELYKGGVLERRQLNMYTRMLTLPLAIGQALIVYFSLNNLTTRVGLPALLVAKSSLHFVAIISVLVFGAFITMWLGELISAYGLGGGSSLIIMAGILVTFPMNLGSSMAGLYFLWQKALVIVILIVTVILAVTMSLAVYNIKVVYAQRVRTTGLAAPESYLPISINPAGVMPIIFSIAVASGLNAAAAFIVRYPEWGWVYTVAVWLYGVFQNRILYNIIVFMSTVVFSVLSAYLVLKPDDMAENLAKQGAFVLGLRPGKETAVYLKKIINRVVVLGGILLGILVVLPSSLQVVAGIPVLAITGSGILIVVAVIIDIIRQLEAVYSNIIEVKNYY